MRCFLGLGVFVFVVAGLSGAQFTLSWTDNSTNEIGFKIERSVDGLNFVQIKEVGANVTSYTDAGLPNTKQYWYRLAAYNSGGNSAYSNVATGTTPTGPALPPVPAAPGAPVLVAQAGYLVNVSVRVNVPADAAFPVTTGFVISGGPVRVLIRAVGPGLLQFGVTDAMADPKITLLSGSTVVVTNDNWDSGDSATDAEIAQAAAKAGAFPFENGSKDSAIVVTLPAGSYTVQTTPATGGPGQALVEVYEVK